MRKLWIAVAVVCALTVALPTMAGGATLRQRVNKLEAKMSCLQRTGMSTWVGYAWYEPDGAVHVVTDPDTDTGGSATNFEQWIPGSPGADYWVLVVKPTQACRAKFGVVTNPYTARAQSTANLQRLARVR